MTDTVIIFTDCDLKSGLGHFSRTFRLVEILQKLYHLKFTFYGSYTNNFAIEKMDALGAHIVNCDSPQLLLDTKKVSSSFNRNLILIDNYNLTHYHEQLLKEQNNIIVRIDDHPIKRNIADLLIIPCLIDKSKKERNYTQANVVSGPNSIILEHYNYAFREVKKIDTPQRCTITFGGGNVGEYTFRLIKKILDRPETIKYDVILAKSDRYFKKVQKLIHKSDHIRLFDQSNSIMNILNQADFVIGAFGYSTWERICLGKPILGSILADNQIEVSNFVRDKNVGLVVNSVDDLIENIHHYIENISDKYHEYQANINKIELNPNSLHLLGLKIGRTSNLVRKSDFAIATPKLLKNEWSSHYHEHRSLITKGKIKNISVENVKSFKVTNSSATFAFNMALVTVDGRLNILVPKHYFGVVSQLDTENILKVLFSYIVRSAPEIKYVDLHLNSSETNNKITIVSDKTSWTIPKLIACLVHDSDQKYNNISELVFSHVNANSLNDCILIGYSSRIDNLYLQNKNRFFGVIHESKVPMGRGWSPLTWQILHGASNVTVSLMEVHENIDAGDVLATNEISLGGTELVEELREAQMASTLRLVVDFIKNKEELIQNKKQQSGEASYYQQRTPSDSLLNVERLLSEQFNQLRVVDNQKYPAYFVYKNQKYTLKIEKNHE